MARVVVQASSLEQPALSQRRAESGMHGRAQADDDLTGDARRAGPSEVLPLFDVDLAGAPIRLPRRGLEQ